MKEPTYEQREILKLFLEKKRGITNTELKNDYWQLVDEGYLNKIDSIGTFPAVFEITQKGIDYLNKEKTV
jgi:predicted transcriptional regulator